MPAREIMPSAVVRVDPATPVREGIALLTERSVAASPVVDSENQVIGFTDHSGCRDRWTISVTAGLVTVTGASRTRPSDGSWPRSHGPVHGVVDVDFRTRGAGT